MASLNETHDPSLKSWVESANGASGFPLQNLPFASFRRAGSAEPFRLGVAIGDQVLDLAAARAHVRGDWDRALGEPRLNALMALGAEGNGALRLALSRALREGSALAGSLRAALVPMKSVEYALPANIGDYTDFYTSIHHATNIGKLFRPDNPLLPNYKWVPIGYHGRASTINVSGTDFHRPRGQTMPPNAQQPVFGPSKRLDYELEMGVYIGEGNAQGRAIPIAEAERHVFGISLLNDWSARDIQAWEYQPLGPFLAKNFATTISPWIVTMEALAPFRVPFARDAADPQPLPYLDSAANRERGAIAIALEVLIQTPAMRAQGRSAVRVSASSFADTYWTPAQLLAHHASNGCNLQPGDLMGSGTQSGPAAGQGGSLLELSQGGKQPFDLGNGETRTFLQDGDTVILRAFCERTGHRRIGFGDCAATVLPART